jgi:hypothetical protein
MTYPDFPNSITLPPPFHPFTGEGRLTPISLLPIGSRDLQTPQPQPLQRQVQRFSPQDHRAYSVYDTLNYSACLTAAPAQPTALRASPQAQCSCNLTYNTYKGYVIPWIIVSNVHNTSNNTLVHVLTPIIGLSYTIRSSQTYYPYQRSLPSYTHRPHFAPWIAHNCLLSEKYFPIKDLRVIL